MIYDYLDLVDRVELFKDKKYIIHVVPAQTDTIREVDIEEEIEDLGNNLTKTFNHKIDEVEHNLRAVMR